MEDEQILALTEGLERAIARIRAVISTHGERQAELLHMVAEVERGQLATAHIVNVLAYLVAANTTAPLAFVHALRAGALDTIPQDEDGSTDKMREPIENALARIEASVSALPQRD